MSQEKSDNNLEIEIRTVQGKLKTTFPKNAKVEEVIQTVIKHFNFAQNGKYDLRLETDPDNALESERPLVSYGIKDGDVLIFTDLGIAVCL